MPHESDPDVRAPQPSGRPLGDPVVGRFSLVFGLGGTSMGALAGVLLGRAFYDGHLALSGLAPLVAGGPGVPAVVFASVLGAALGLAGGIVGLHLDARTLARSGPEPGHRTSRWVTRRLPWVGLGLLAAGMVVTLVTIVVHGVGGGTTSSQGGRSTWHLKNATRVGGLADDQTERAALVAAYPATRAENRPRRILEVPADWRIALAVTPLVARPHDAAIVIESESAPDAASPVLFAGVLRERISATDPAALAADIDARLHAGGHPPDRRVIVVAADADARWALPAGAYAARTGTSILFVARDHVPTPTLAALQRRGGEASIYALGRRDLFGPAVMTELRRHGTVHAITAGDPVAAAVAFAEYRDATHDFGWGRRPTGTHRRASGTTILVAEDRWQDAIGAVHLARRGHSGPLVFIERDRIPPVVDVHLWRQRPVFAATPAEGPFNQLWVVGSFDRIAFGPQAWADYSQEIGQSMTLGPSAVSGYEVLAIAWIALSLACATWIVLHGRRLLRAAMPAMRAAWACLALLLGPVALLLYVRSYHRKPRFERGGMVMWHRPPASQAISATAMMFGFDMLAMVLAVFALASLGFPIIRADGPLYWMGTSMFLMMIGMYLVALVVVMLLFHGPMTMHDREVSYGRALLVGLPMMALTMLVESIGMMPTMWWQQMSFLPAMQMPFEDDVTMWATLLVAVFAGFLVVLPFNYWMVKHGRKSGSM